jgi:hypothetical protein
MHPLDLECQMHLPGTPEFAEPLENPADDFLDTAIRIEAQADLPMPDIADRYRDPEFRSAGLRSRGIQHPRSEDAAAGDRWDRMGHKRRQDRSHGRRRDHIARGDGAIPCPAPDRVRRLASFCDKHFRMSLLGDLKLHRPRITRPLRVVANQPWSLVAYATGYFDDCDSVEGPNGSVKRRSSQAYAASGLVTPVSLWSMTDGIGRNSRASLPQNLLRWIISRPSQILCCDVLWPL